MSRLAVGRGSFNVLKVHGAPEHGRDQLLAARDVRGNIPDRRAPLPQSTHAEIRAQVSCEQSVEERQAGRQERTARTWIKTHRMRMGPGQRRKPPTMVTTIIPTYMPAAMRRLARVMFLNCFLKPSKKLHIKRPTHIHTAKKCWVGAGTVVRGW